MKIMRGGNESSAMWPHLYNVRNIVWRHVHNFTILLPEIYFGIKNCQILSFQNVWNGIKHFCTISRNWLFLVEHDCQVRILHGEENVVDIRTHVTLLEQRRAEESPLRPLFLRVALVVRVIPEVEVFQACVRRNKLCVKMPHQFCY